MTTRIIPPRLKARLLSCSFFGPSPVGGRTHGGGFTMPGTPISDHLVGVGVMPGREVAVGGTGVSLCFRIAVGVCVSGDVLVAVGVAVDGTGVLVGVGGAGVAVGVDVGGTGVLVSVGGIGVLVG